MKSVKQITIFSTSWCPYCKQEEEWLQDNKLDFKTVMVDEDEEVAEYITKKTQQNAVPVAEIIFQDDSVEYVVGFDKSRLSKILLEGKSK